MSGVTDNDTAPELHHAVEGPSEAAGPGGAAPALVLGPSLGTSLGLWEPQTAALARSRRVVRYDLPGHGGSPASVLPHPEPGGTTVADLAALVLALADRQGLTTFHYAGVSLGGAVGTHLAAHHPERIASLALICTSARFGGRDPWLERGATVREKGMAPLLATAPGRWFALPGTAESSRGAALLRDHAEADPAGYAACCDALAEFDLRHELTVITAPTLVIAGRGDAATPMPHSRELADGIEGAELAVVEGGHLAPTESPDEVAALLLAHIAAAEES
jgi:3-oxoadipate enol-lactonase